MLSYVARRVLEVVPLIVVILTVNFVILHVAPGDPVFLFIQGGEGTTVEYVEMIRHRLGLDRPLAAQLGIFIANAFRGDLGYSYFYQESVTAVIAERMPVTFLLVALATFFAAVIGILMGAIAGAHPYSAADRINTVVAVFGYSIPVFWLGQLLIIAFSICLGILPTGGIPIQAVGGGGFLDWLSHLVLPVSCLTVVQLALVARITRAAMLEVINMDYITNARAKGLSECVITLKHALRNAVLPVVTVVNLNFSRLLTGAMLIETVFSWPGLGRMMLESLLRRDYPVLIGLLIVLSTGVVCINLITDVLYAYLDPRIVYE
jgi:peptide/nickel transport system permease protein